jgi:putative ABC transport system ATP-binding protein
MKSPDPVVQSDAVAQAAALVAQLEGIERTYYKPDGSVLVQALAGIDLDIAAGEYMAIMGASGSGKSTLMNVMGCLDRPTAGRYLLAGREVSAMSDDELSEVRGRKIGFVFQAFNLISELDIVDNVAVPLFYQSVPRQQRRPQAIEMLRMVGLGDRLGHRPRELSGGQQQRVAIARALVNDPAIILAGEPTGIDELHGRGMTLIVVTHDEAIADRCQRVIRLRDGLVETDLRR